MYRTETVNLLHNSKTSNHCVSDGLLLFLVLNHYKRYFVGFGLLVRQYEANWKTEKNQVSVTSITQEICETCGVYARFKTISVKFWAPLFEPFQLIQKYNKHIISWGKPQCQDWLAIQAHQKISLPAFFTLCLSWYSCMFNHQISYEVPI